MNSNDINGHKLWAYIHNELDDAGRLHVEKAIENEPGFRKRLNSMEELDRQMRKLMPAAEQSEQALEEAVLKAWEEATRSVREEPTMQYAWARIRERLTGRLVPPPVIHVAFAAAACLLLVVGGYNYSQGPLGWSEAQIAAGPSFRGSDASAAPLDNREAIERGTVNLHNSIIAHYEATGPKRAVWERLLGRQTWICSANVQPLPQGKLLVQVVAVRAKGKVPAREWSQYFGNAEEFSRQTDAWAAEITRGLVELQSSGNPAE